ncbi:hypothetical protein BH11ACT2_BH11ACT2_07700 [soil metagenome]
METIASLFGRNDGIITTRQLTEAGYASHQLTALVRSGELVRIRNGWYASSEAHPELVAAVRVGGRLAGISAAGWHGLATPQRHALHVQVPANSSRLRSSVDRHLPLVNDFNRSVMVHWGGSSAATPAARLVLPLPQCLRQVVLFENEDDAVACLDSALHQGAIDRIDLELLRLSLPQRYRHVIAVTDERSEGYPESVLRRRLARAGIPTQLQVKVLDERWIDLLIGDRLAAEVGASTHRTPRAERMPVAGTKRGGARALLPHPLTRRVRYATPAIRGSWNVPPKTRSEAPERSRYGVMPPAWNG